MTKIIKELEERDIKTLMLKMSIPAVLGMLSTALYSMVDRLYISNMIDGTNQDYAMSALTVVNPFTLVALAFLLLVTGGSTTLISLFLGQKKKEDAEKMLGNSLLVLIVGALLLGVVGLIFEKPLLYMLGAEANTYAYAHDYFSVICGGIVFLAISFGLTSNIRSEGNANASMFIMALGAALNIILDPVFIGPLNMGVKGAAVATILAQAISAVVAVWYYVSGKSVLRLKLKYLKPDVNLIGYSLWIGASQCLLQLVASFTTGIYNSVLRIHGDYMGANIGTPALAAYGIISMITQLFLMCIYGINQGVQPIFGYNYGAKRYDRVKETFKWTVYVATGFLTVGCLICIIFPNLFVSIFKGTNEAKSLVAHGLRIQVIFWPIIAASYITSSYFQSIGRPVTSAVLAISRHLAFLIPLLIILPQFWGIDGAWWATPIADVLSTVMSFVYVKYHFKRLG